MLGCSTRIRGDVGRESLKTFSVGAIIAVVDPVAAVGVVGIVGVVVASSALSLSLS